MYIANQEELDAFVARASKSSLLAIDTEFLREKTYYPQLCLLQMATEDEVVIVDPFSMDDLGVLAPLLTSRHTVKLFHAGNQDLDILFHECGVATCPVFDTQIAAALLGYTQQMGYGPLVNSLCGVNLKKVDSFTDWSKRPLSRSQIKYAADDVVYLPQMYHKMTKKLRELGRLDWLADDFRSLEDPARYETNARDRFKHLKRISQLNRHQMSAAREVAAWREERAQRCNLPRKWILTDEQIIEACKREAKTIDELFMVRGVSDRISTKDARHVVSCLRAGFDAPREDWPMLNERAKSEVNVDSIVDVMSALVRLRARQNDIAFQTLASHASLADVARGYEDVDVLQGWRREIIGSDLLALLAGHLFLKMKNGRLVIEEADR